MASNQDNGQRADALILYVRCNIGEHNTMALGVVLNTEANGRADSPPPAFDGAQSLMGDNITRELVARHATDDAKHTVLKLFHLNSVRQDRRQLGWSQSLVTEGNIDRLAQRSHGILEIHLTVGVGRRPPSPLE